MGALHGARVELHPAGIRQFYKTAGGGGEPFQIGLGKFQSFRFPFSGDGQPVNAAALDDQARLELARRQEQTMERGVAQEFRLGRPGSPDFGERAEEIFIGIANPQARFLHEPIQLAQPLNGGVEPRIIKDFRFFTVLTGRSHHVAHPFVAVPEPGAFIAQTFREQPQADGIVQQLKNELRRGGMRDAELFPVHSVIRLGLAQMQEQAMAQLAHGHGRLLGEMLQDAVGRCVAEQKEFVADEGERRLPVEKSDVRHGITLAVRQREAMRERQFLLVILKVRVQRHHVPVKMQRLMVDGGFEAIGMPPARQPLEQFGVGEQQGVRIGGAFAMRVVNPLDEFPILRREQFLLMRGADHEVHKIVQRPGFFTRARAQQEELQGQLIARRLGGVRLRRADHAQGGAGRIEVQRGGRREPMFQFLDELRFLFGFLRAGETVQAGVRLQFRGHGSFGAQKQKGQFFQPRFALGGEHFGPPIGRGKIAARERKFFKIILQRQPRPLRIRAGRKSAQNLLALGDRGFGVGQFAA